MCPDQPGALSSAFRNFQTERQVLSSMRDHVWELRRVIRVSLETISSTKEMIEFLDRLTP